MTGRTPKDQEATLTISLSREGIERELPIGADDILIDVIRKLGLPPDGILIFSGTAPLPLDKRVGDLENNRIKVIIVSSGG